MLTKELISQIASATGLSKRSCDILMDSMVASIKDAVLEGKDVQIQGLGTLEVRETKSRKMRQPKTGETITIPAGQKLGFRPSQAVRKEVR